MMVLCTKTSLSGLKTTMTWPFKVFTGGGTSAATNLGKELHFEP